MLSEQTKQKIQTYKKISSQLFFVSVNNLNAESLENLSLDIKIMVEQL